MEWRPTLYVVEAIKIVEVLPSYNAFIFYNLLCNMIYIHIESAQVHIYKYRRYIFTFFIFQFFSTVIYYYIH